MSQSLLAYKGLDMRHDYFPTTLLIASIASIALPPGCTKQVSAELRAAIATVGNNSVAVARWFELGALT
jgi:hypothetical protein